LLEYLASIFLFYPSTLSIILPRTGFGVILMSGLPRS